MVLVNHQANLLLLSYSHQEDIWKVCKEVLYSMLDQDSDHQYKLQRKVQQIILRNLCQDQKKKNLRNKLLMKSETSCMSQRSSSAKNINKLKLSIAVQ